MVKNKKLFKVVVYGPLESETVIRNTIEKLEVGKVGNYTGWTFCSYGTTRVTALSGANPARGKIGIIEKIEEFRMETTCFESELESLVLAIKSVHPYEVVPIDVIPIREVSSK